MNYVELLAICTSIIYSQRENWTREAAVAEARKVIGLALDADDDRLAQKYACYPNIADILSRLLLAVERKFANE